MLLTAAEGYGCWFCEHGRPVDYVESRAGKVALCLECVLRWFPGRSADWWEARHAPLRDHLGDRLKEAIRRQCYAALAQRWRLERQEAQDAQDPADAGGGAAPQTPIGAAAAGGVQQGGAGAHG